MRVTNNMMVNGTIRNINDASNRLDNYYEQMSTQKKFQYPSDDPVGVTQSMRLNTSIVETDQYTKNADDSSDWMTATDTALGQFGDILQRLKQLAVTGANDTLPIESMNALADEVSQLKDQVYLLGNSEQTGRYLFAGTLTLQSPFAKQPDGSIQYRGNTGDISTELGVGVKITNNINGQRAFGDIFTQLTQFETDLRSNNVAGVANAIDTLDKTNDSVLELRSEMGAKVNRMDMNKDRLDTLKLNYQKLLSNVQDIDFADTVMKLKQEEAVQQAALSTGARIIQPTLVDYLK